MTITQMEIKRAFWDRKFEKELKTFFRNQGKEIANLRVELNRFERAAIQQVNQDATKLRKIYAGMYNGIVTDFGTAVYNELTNEKVFSIFALGVYSWIAATILKNTNLVNSYTILTIKNVVQKGNEEGWTVDLIADTLKTIFLDRFSKKRAKRIARTEVNSASNYGSFAGAQQTGLELKKIWIATNDKRTRPSHKKAGRHAPVGMNEKFTVGKSKMLYPGDPDGRPEEIINCRCAIGYRRY